MSFTRFCAVDFTPTTRHRGQQYWNEGRVRELQVDQAGAVAAVAGQGGEYAVNVSFAHRGQGVVTASCECPFYEGGQLCKHIWAVLLALDRSCEVRLPRGRQLAVIPSLAVDQGDIHSTFLPPHGGAFEVVSRDGTPLAAARPRDNWVRFLSDVAHQSLEDAACDSAGHLSSQPAERPDREVVYVLNVAESELRRQLTIDLFERRLRRSGGRNKGKRLILTRSAIRSLPTEDDRWLATVLAGNDVSNHRLDHLPFGYPADPSFNRCRISSGMYDLILPRMAATGRLVWLLDDSLPLEEGLPITWAGESPWRSRLEMATDESAQQWRLDGVFHRDGRTRPVREAVLLLADGLVLFPEELARCDAGADRPWMRTLARNGPVVIPFQDRVQWLNRLVQLSRLPELDLPEDLRVECVTGTPTPHLEITAPDRVMYAWQHELVLRVDFDYGARRFAESEADVGCFDESSNRMILRDRPRERALRARLLPLGCEELPPDYRSNETRMVIAPRMLPELVRVLTEEGWVVVSQGVRMRRPGTFKLHVTSGVDWFELNGKVDFDGVSVPLPALLAALRNNESTVHLDDGSQGILPEEWLKKYARLAQLAETDGTSLHFGKSQALLLDALLEEQGDVRVDEEFAGYRGRLRQFAGIRPAEPPDSFRGELRPYQKEGLGWLYFLREFGFGGCLADDMGLGKTVQVLALLDSHRRRIRESGTPSRPSIVVVPKSLVFNWVDEARRFAPELRILNHTGTDRGEKYALVEAYDVLVTTYGTLRRDIVRLKDFDFEYGILDEAQAIKNADSQAAKACRLVRARHRLAMTGTPVENHLGELWSLFDYLNPGMLGRSSAFASLARNGRDVDPQMLDVLSRALRPFLLRRTKEQVLEELPEKTQQTLYCALSSKERKAYNELRHYFRRQLAENVREKGLARSKIHVLEALLRLRQAACHPGLLDPGKTGELSSKLETLLEKVEQIIEEGHKGLVFSQFTSLLGILRRHLDKRGIPYEYLDGQTRNRRACVKRFQEDGECPLFLISLKAGGHGLNLTAADYVFILDPWWNPAVEAQAVDRAHRIGQTRRVFAYRLIAQDTVEDKILELQQSKRDLAEAIVSANGSLIRNLSTEDLDLLLS